MRNSTFRPEYRKLSGDARQWKERVELTLEQLPEIRKRVGADGSPPLQGQDIRCKSVSGESMKFVHKIEWYRGRVSLSSL